MKRIHFGTCVTIDGVPDCPAFTFSFNHGLNGKQYTFKSPERGCFLLTYTTTYEDIEVGAGFLEVYNTQDRTEHLFEVRFSHDGDASLEIWGFSLQELVRGFESCLSPSAE